MIDDPNNPDAAAIEEFHRAARKRKALTFGVGGLFALIGGVIAIVISFGVEDARTGSRMEAKVLVGGILLVLFGLGALYNAYRLGTGKINDVAD